MQHIGQDRIARLQVVLSQQLPKGGPLQRLGLTAVALAPTDEKGWCAWTIERLSKSIRTRAGSVAGHCARSRPDRLSSAFRDLHKAGLIKLRFKSRRIVGIRIPTLPGEPTDFLQREKQRRDGLMPSFAAMVLHDVPNADKISLDTQTVIAWAMHLRAGREMNRAELANELGLSARRCFDLAPSETRVDGKGRVVGLLTPPPKLPGTKWRSNLRCETRNCHARNCRAYTHACAHSNYYRPSKWRIQR